MCVCVCVTVWWSVSKVDGIEEGVGRKERKEKREERRREEEKRRRGEVVSSEFEKENRSLHETS